MECFFCGSYPRRVHFHIRRFPIEDVPSDSKGLTDWIYHLYREKDELIKYLYANGQFPSKENNRLSHIFADSKEVRISSRNGKPIHSSRSPTRRETKKNSSTTLSSSKHLLETIEMGIQRPSSDVVWIGYFWIVFSLFASYIFLPTHGRMNLFVWILSTCYFVGLSIFSTWRIWRGFDPSPQFIKTIPTDVQFAEKVATKDSH